MPCISENGYEIACVKLLLSRSVTIFCAYRPGDCTLTATKSLLRRAESSISEQFLLCGDLNLPSIDWETLTASDAPGRRLLDFSLQNNLTQHVASPTRGKNILDLLLGNRDLLSNVQVKESFSNSDHNIVQFQLNCETNKQESTKTVRNFSADYLARLNTYLLGLNWHSFLNTVYSTSAKYQKFVEAISSSVNTTVPLKLVNKRKKSHYPPYLKRLISEKRRIHRLVRRNPTRYKQAYKRKCLEVKCSLRKHRNHLEYRVISKGPTAIYKFVSSKLSSNTEIPTLVYNSNICVSDAEKSEALANHFSKTFLSSATPFVPPGTGYPEVCLSDINFDILDVQRLLSSLPDRNGTSPDQISYKILKNCADSLSPIVTELFRTILDSGEVPALWKTSIVVPIFKKGNPEDCSNYRPISLTCTLSRTLERLVVRAMLRFFTETSFFDKNQFGFLKGRSTTTQLLTTLDDWFYALDAKENIDAVYVDFAKAFDSVKHDRLLYKLHKAGISGKLYKFIESFLTGRTFQVRINDSFSRSYPITQSVPQGSVLGPILFLIYINDLPSYIPPTVGIKLYADDVKLYRSHGNDARRIPLQEALTGLERWSLDWLVDIAAQKCLVIHFGTGNAAASYSIHGCPLPTTDCIRDLGVLIDNKLSFTKHVSHVIQVAYLKAHQILKILKTKNLKTLIFAYKVYVRPHLEYAVESWQPKLKKDVLRLEKVQRYYTRTAYKKCYMKPEPYKERLKKCNLESLEFRRKVSDLSMVHKILHKKTSIDPSKHFTRSTRHRFNSLQLLMRHHSSKTQHNFFVRTINVWNSLPDTIVTAQKTESFVNQLTSSGIIPNEPPT